MMKLTRISLRSRRGVSEMLWTVMAIPFFAIVFSFIAYFGRALYAKAAIEDAAATGARFAVTSLSGQKGCQQAQAAMLEVLKGHYLDPAGASLSVVPKAGWGRNASVIVKVSYTVRQPTALFFSKSLGDSRISTFYEVVVDGYNNRYSNGWQPCVFLTGAPE